MKTLHKLHFNFEKKDILGLNAIHFNIAEQQSFFDYQLTLVNLYIDGEPFFSQYVGLCISAHQRWVNLFEILISLDNVDFKTLIVEADGVSDEILKTLEVAVLHRPEYDMSLNAA